METICFFNTAIPWGGGEKWHLETADFLHQKGISVHIVCHKKSVLFQKAKSKTIPHTGVSISNLSILNPLKYAKISQVFKTEKISTIVINLSQDLKVGGIAAKLANVNRIIYRRGSAIPVKNTALNRYLYKHIVDEVLVNSKATLNCILELNPSLFPQERVSIIPNGIDIEQFNKNSFDVYYEKKQNEIVLTNLGRIEEQKNQIFLIKVAALLKEKGVQFKMIIGGEGRLLKTLKFNAQSLGVEDFIQFVGFVKNPINLYMSGDVFLLSSLWEGFGYVIVEAGACKKPVIAFNSSSNPEVVINKKTGLLTPHNELDFFCKAILKFYHQRSLITTMGEAALKHVSRAFDKKIIFKKIEKFLLHSKKIQITAIITTFNEEKNIRRALESVKWVDEILVVDSFSTDQTVSICKSYGASILQRKYDYPAAQKNWAIPKASNPWIILLDADECVSEKLQNEILSKLKTSTKHTAFWIKRKNYFLGKRIRYSGWQTDKVIRFFKKEHHQYQDKRVHEEIKLTSNIGKLKGEIIHYTATDYQAYKLKIERYAQYGAEELYQKDIPISLFQIWLKPGFKFFVSYIVRGGFLDGKKGFLICKLKAHETHLRAKITKQMRYESL